MAKSHIWGKGEVVELADGGRKSTFTCPCGVVSVVVRYPVFGADGKLHPKFDPYPKSKFFKNGKPLKEAGVCPITNR